MSPRRVAPQSRAAAVGALFAAITGAHLPPPPPPDGPPPTGTPDALFGTAGNPILRVTPGAYCDLEGAHGTSPKGRAMRCRLKPGEERPRWRRP